MRQLKSAREIDLMRKAGLTVWRAHQAAAKLVGPGITTGELDAAVADVFKEVDAEPLFLGYPGPTPFPAVTCISVNEEVVHGIPGERKLVDGDIVSIDTGCRIDGWCGDAAVTYAIGEVSEDCQRLLRVTSGVLDLAIELLGTKSKWSEVAREMQEFVEAENLSVVREFVGHGIGREMHEAPQVPNYYSNELAGSADFKLKTGIVLAIEPMVNVGTDKTKCLEDGWTQVTRDGSPSAHFEHTVALTSDGPVRLTGAPDA